MIVHDVSNGIHKVCILLGKCTDYIPLVECAFNINELCQL